MFFCKTYNHTIIVTSDGNIIEQITSIHQKYNSSLTYSGNFLTMFLILSCKEKM